MLIDRYECWMKKHFFFSPINCSDIFIKNKQERWLKKVLNNKIYLWIIFMSNIFLRCEIFFFFFLSRNLARFDFFHPPIYILICMIVKLSALLIESRYVERDNRKRISINKSHVRNFNFFVFYNFPLLILSFEICKTSNLFIKFISSFFLSLSFIYRPCNY